MTTEWVHRFRCTACGHRFRVHAPTSDTSRMVEPECPTCAKVLRARGMDVASGRAPATQSILTRAADETARITMEDHGLTDLRDDNRVGESSAPKLPVHMQEQADAMFSGKPPPSAANPAAAAAMRMFDPRVILPTAIAGGYGTPGTAAGPADALAATHAAKLRVPVTLMEAGKKLPGAANRG